MNKTLLVYDLNNIFHKNYHTAKNHGDLSEVLDMTLAATIRDMKIYYDRFSPLMTMAAIDARTNWRKDYTSGEDAVTHKVYKAHRNEKLTKKERDAKKALNELIQEFAGFLKNSTKIITLWEDSLEADDMASGVCRIFGDSEYEIKIVSSDKDYLQFYRYSNVQIVNPLAGGHKRNLQEWNNDADLYIFEKCIRGDSKDNVISSYPRLRKTALVEAFYDDYKRSNVLNHTFTETVFDKERDDYIEIEYSTEALFNENMLLLDLNKQPDHIKELIDSVVEREITRKRTFNFVKFLQLCKRHELNNLSARAQNFIPLFSNKSKS